MLNNMPVVIRRIEQRTVSKESALQQVQLTIHHIQSEITAGAQQRDLLLRHLSSLIIAGSTSLEAILDNKARQGSLQRKVAEMELMLADKHHQLQQQCQHHASLKAERIQMQRKSEKLIAHVQQRQKQQLQCKQRQHETETEEQLNWQR